MPRYRDVLPNTLVHPSRRRARLPSQKPSRAGHPRSAGFVAAAGCVIMSTAFCTGCPRTGSGAPQDACDAAGTICTVAGTGLSLFDGDGKDALETSFYYPLDIEFDAQGRPLILDFNNLRIRRLNDDGTIETVMGLDYEDAPLDGALASETPLHHASDIEMDFQGRLYVAGDHVPVVILVDTENRVHFVAGSGEFGYEGDGGPALEARLVAPFGVLPDDRGGFYISDLDANVIRYVDPEGIIRTVAGDGTPGYSGDGGAGPNAQLNAPTRMRLLPDGSLLICDTDNNVIRRLNPDGTITTFAGTGASGYSGDGGPAAAATLTRPYDVRIGPDGALYVADTGNHAIRRIDQTGFITTVVGTGTEGFSGDGSTAHECQLNGPSSVTFDAEGAMWICDTYNQRVRRIAAAESLVDP